MDIDYSEHSLDRAARIIGQDGLDALSHSTVMVFGLGGVGSACVEALARGGVGRLIVIDRDIVQPSNINRQVIAYNSTLGRPKVDVVRSMVADIAPETEVITHHALVLQENLEDFFAIRPDYIVDALDTMTTKWALAQYANDHDIPLVSSMGAANKIHPESLEFADLYDTEWCPMCRVMRKGARKRGITKLRVLYAHEHPIEVASAEGADRKERTNLGTMSYFPPIMGMMLAGDVIQSLVGLEPRS